MSQSCTPYNRRGDGFSIQSISPNAVAMLASVSKDTCLLPRGSNTLTLSAPELLQIRQTLSACPITPSAIVPIDVSTRLAILQTKRNNTGFLSYALERGPGLGILDTNFGWDNEGIWFSGDATGVSDASYPIFTNFTIPSDKQVEVSVDFVNNEGCADFGLCFYPSGTIPEWQWNSNETRIACQYDCPIPVIHGLTDSNDDDEDVLTTGNTYTCNVIYNPNSNPNITFNTKFNETIINTLTIDDQVLTSDYRIGFTADQDDDEFKTYIKNLIININNGEAIYESSLQNITIPLILS